MRPDRQIIEIVNMVAERNMGRGTVQNSGQCTRRPVREADVIAGRGIIKCAARTTRMARSAAARSRCSAAPARRNGDAERNNQNECDRPHLSPLGPRNGQAKFRRLRPLHRKQRSTPSRAGHAAAPLKCTAYCGCRSAEGVCGSRAKRRVRPAHDALAVCPDAIRSRYWLA